MTFVHDNISETNFLVHFLKVYQINKVLLYSTGNYLQYSRISHNGNYEKESVYMHTYITESLGCTIETNTL